MYRHGSIIYIEKLLFFKTFPFYEIQFDSLRGQNSVGRKLLGSHLLSKSSCQLSQIFQVNNKVGLIPIIEHKIKREDHTTTRVSDIVEIEESDWLWTVKFGLENYFKNKQKKYSAYKHTNCAAFILDWITTIEFTFFLIRFWVEIDKWFEPGRSLNLFTCFIFQNSYLFSMLSCIMEYFINHIYVSMTEMQHWKLSRLVYNSDLMSSLLILYRLQVGHKEQRVCQWRIVYNFIFLILIYSCWGKYEHEQIFKVW